MMVFPLAYFCLTFWNAANVFHYEPQSEFEVKATIILRLLEFVDWPDSRNRDPLRIGFMETESEFREVVQKVLGKKTVQGRSIQFVPLGEDLLGVDLLIIGAGLEKELDEVVDLCRDQSILLVSAARGFAKKGSHINLVVSQSKVKFEVNLRTLRSSGVSISSQVLRLALIVDDGKEEDPDE